MSTGERESINVCILRTRSVWPTDHISKRNDVNTINVIFLLKKEVVCYVAMSSNSNQTLAFVAQMFQSTDVFAVTTFF